MYNIINNIIYTFLIILNNYNKYVEMSKCRNVEMYLYIHLYLVLLILSPKDFDQFSLSSITYFGDCIFIYMYK